VSINRKKGGTFIRKFHVILTLFSFLQLNVIAQEYRISFSGSGASETVDSIQVENLSDGRILTIKGGDILRLTGTVGINSDEYDPVSGIWTFPNPFKGTAAVEFLPPVAGPAIIEISDISGKQLLFIRKVLDKSQFKLRLSGFGSGHYFIAIRGKGYLLTGTLISVAESGDGIIIEEAGYDLRNGSGNRSKYSAKGTQITVDMLYKTGDRLKFTGMSGNYRTVITDIPVADALVNFSFLPCTDADGNSYQVVEIGSQTWMAENLKATKFFNGTEIPNITDHSEWSSLTSPAYCWYNNDTVFKNSYGALYNWYAVNTGYLCPIGWRFPTSAEWTALITFLGGPSVAATHMKETGTTHWADQNIADNSSGFSALPGGVRMDTYLPWIQTGVFDHINRSAWFTASDEAGEQYAYWLELSNDSEWATLQNSYPKNTGFSVRCILNK
jgi:uncharacterized protein (TIGR02145 family)